MPKAPTLRSLGLAALVAAACTPSPAPTPPIAGSATGSASVDAPSAHANAVAKVKDLTAKAEANVVLAAWTGPYGGVPPWDKLKPELFPAAFELAIALKLAQVDAIAENPEPATFENTVAALEDAGRHQYRAEILFAVFTNNLNGKDVQEIDRVVSPKLTAAKDDLFFNEKLFARLTAVYEGRSAGNLTAEQKRLLERTYDAFVRAGAKLDAAGKKRLGELNQELSVLFIDFGNKVLEDEKSFVVLSDKKDLAGLSDELVAKLANAAKERGVAGMWIVTNTRSSVDPFLAASSRRDLREKVWKAFKGRGDNGDANDTNSTIAKIVKLRAERAKLLGFATHAHWRMSDTMAVDPEKAKSLMMKVWPAAVKRVGEEVKDMLAVAKKDDKKLTVFEPWDYLYYAEKVRKAKYDLDQAEVKPYFELENMIAASFFMAGELYGLDFKEITGKVPVFRPDIRVWEVVNKSDGKHVGLFYGDYFARTDKRSGAWAMGYRDRESFTGKVVTPIMSNNNNFVRGGEKDPILISLDDAETLFHEFGHALHGLLSEVNYPGLGDTPRDFVEYPSQVHEMWVLTRPVLDRFAKHAQTKKPMPQALVDKVLASEKFNTGYSTVEYLSAAIVDMELHTADPTKLDPDAFERDTLTRIGAPREVAMRHRIPQFNHLFTSDSYSAGYYSYLWSEVMDADTREAFVATGSVFDKATADKLRKFILSPGNSTDRAEAYRQFRGRDPDVTALLKKRGFPTP
jgi:peptidyl-dipeptidase Dcp